MILIKYNLFFSGMSIGLCSSNIGAPHVHHNGFQFLSLLRGKLLEGRLKDFSIALVSPILHRRVINVINQRLIMMPFGKRLVIHTHSFRNSVKFRLSTTLNHSFHHASTNKPVQVQQTTRAFDAAFLLRINNKDRTFIGHFGMVFTKPGDNLQHPVFSRFNPRKTNTTDGSHLASIQMRAFSRHIKP